MILKTGSEAKIEQLVEFINHHNDLYYIKNEPVISDYEFDMALRELEQLEIEFPEYKKANSPTTRVGSDIENTFDKIKHTVQLGSLQDVFSCEEVEAFCNKMPKDVKFIVEPKIDGLSVALRYENGELVTGATRGDGFEGEDVTQNIKTIKSIPLKLKTPVEFLEVRGEVYMSEKSFQKLLETEPNFKNPRNAAVGSLRQKNSKITAKRGLDIFVFNVQEIRGKEFESHQQSLDYLKEQGFKVSPRYKLFDNAEDVIAEIEYIGNERYNFKFDIDGAVVKVDNLARREDIGYTSKVPKWAVAYKYPPEEKQTTLLDIEITVGRTGALTPTAIFDPIQLAGTTVSRAVLHNQDFIDQKDIRIGDIIVVRKAGDIIPEVVSSIEHKSNSEPFKLPTICPSCGVEVVKTDSTTRCTNDKCPSAMFRNIAYFASKNAMNIDGLGEATVQTLIEQNMVNNIADLYELDIERLLEIERMGKRSVENLMKSIEKSKQQPLSRFIYGLGIRNIGSTSSKILCAKFTDLDSLKKATYDEIVELEGYGDIMAQAVVEYFEKSDNIAVIDRLASLGVNPVEQQSIVGDMLNDKTFVITGTLPTMGRTQMKELIEKNGGKVSGSVSKKTSYVVAGEEAGSKLDKANQLNIEVLNEQQLLKMINGG